MDKKVSRVTRNKSQARSNYNRLSRWYDTVAGSSEEKFRQFGVQLLDPQEGDRILEIGFGTGHCLVAFADAVGERGHVTGIDLSEGMASVALRRIHRDQRSERIDLCLADGVALPFCTSYFHKVFISFTLELFDTPEISLVLDQCRRVLQPTGSLVNVSLAKTSRPGLAERLYEWFHARMPVLIDCRPIDGGNVLMAAGFKIRETSRSVMWGLPVDIISAKLPTG